MSSPRREGRRPNVVVFLTDQRRWDTTGYIGKWHLAGRDPVPAAVRGGFREWLASNVLEMTSDPYDTVKYDEREQPESQPGYRVDALADATIRFIDRHRMEPFFLFLSFLEPHHQNRLDDYPAPEGYRERYQGRWLPPNLAALGGTAHQHLAGYYGMVKRLDETFGRLLDALRSLGLRDDTVVLFTSDLGCHFRTRNDKYKRSPHEASIRVPALLTGPGYELKNLAGLASHRELCDGLRERLIARMDAAGETAPEIVPATSRQRAQAAVLAAEPHA